MYGQLVGILISVWVWIGCNHVAFSFVILPLRPSTIMERQCPVVLLQGSSSDQHVPLCDLQTLLRLTGSLQSGGSAKVAIQSGTCSLNGGVETRRAKKLFSGDVVFFEGVEYNVDEVVSRKNYIYKSKEKKVKPKAAVDEYGNKEFGGRYRSDEWRAERKQKKADRKNQNASNKTTD